MATFIVEVKDKAGKVSKEKVEANSPEQARNLLQSKYNSIGKFKKAGAEFDLSNL